MRSRIVAGLLTLAGAGLLAGCGGSGHSSAAAPTGQASGAAAGDGTIDVAHLDQVQADVLVNGRGFALYMFVPDKRASVTCQGLCADSWPPDRGNGHGRVRAGAGVEAGLLGSDADPAGGARVVTYDGWPLYRYAGDPQAGYASGQGIDLNGGYWYLLRPDGQPLVPAGFPEPVPTP